MSKISLEWFFQIPGLFITIGVLLILIALLVLIIGSSKARNKKVDDLALADDTEPEPVVNEVNPINIASVNHLGGVSNINNLASNTDGFQNNNVNMDIPKVEVQNNSIASLDNPINATTPVNVNDNNVSAMTNVNNVNVAGGDSTIVPTLVEPTSLGNVLPINDEIVVEPASSLNEGVPVIVSPVTNDEATVENTVNDNVNDSIMKDEVTVAPIFANDTVNEVSTITPLDEPVAMSIGGLDEVAVQDNSLNNEEVIQNVEPITPISAIEMIEPIKPTTPLNNDMTLESPTLQEVNVELGKNPVVENSEIEEIL